MSGNDSREENARRGVDEGRVKRYRDLWVVVGDDEYVVEGKFCSCPDYFYNISSGDLSAERCWHSMAVEEASEEGKYDVVDGYYHHFMDLE